MAKPKEVTLIWKDSVLEIIGSYSVLENQVLSYMSKSLEPDPATYGRKVVKQKVNVFNLIQEEGPRIVHTYQGLREAVAMFCYSKGININSLDYRTPFPEPVFDKFGGFWHSQEELLREFLARDSSGLLVAPTRFGKTAIMINMMRAYPSLTTVLCAPGVDLLSQLCDELTLALPDREVKGIFTGSRGKLQSDDITVCSYDSLHKCVPENTGLLICDEPHSAVTTNRVVVVNKFHRARKFGVGATVEGRFDGGDILIKGVFGPKLAERTFPDAVKEGAILMIKVFMLTIPINPFRVTRRDYAYDKVLFKNMAFNSMVADMANTLIPQDWQTLLFIKNENQADGLNRHITGSKVGMAKKMKTKERSALFEELKSDELKRCVCSGIYSTGVTFPDLKVVVNLTGGGGNIESIQKPGRLAQVRPDKKFGYLIDFMFTPAYPDGKSSRDYPYGQNAWLSLAQDSRSRLKVYKDKGYDVKVVSRLDEIKLA